MQVDAKSDAKNESKNLVFFGRTAVAHATPTIITCLATAAIIAVTLLSSGCGPATSSQKDTETTAPKSSNPAASMMQRKADEMTGKAEEDTDTVQQ